MFLRTIDAKEGTPRTVALRRIFRETAIALVVVFLLFAPYLAQFLRVGKHMEDVRKGRNAFWFMWQPGDLQSLLACMIGISLLAVLIREILRAIGLRLLLKLWDHAFVLALGGGLLANLWFHSQRPHGYYIGQFGMEIQTGWLLLFAVAAYSMARPELGLVRRCGQLCLVLSPAMLIVLWQFTQLPIIKTRHEQPFVPQTATAMMSASTNWAAPNHSVYLFIFDEWSYSRTYQNYSLSPEFRNLAELSAQATVFHNAHSPGTHTHKSLPCILRGTPDCPEITYLTPGFMPTTDFVPASAYPSIFSNASCDDYQKIMLNWGFATNIWIDRELNYRNSYSCYARSDKLTESMALHLYNAVFFWTDPWTTLVYDKLKPYHQKHNGLLTYQRLRDDIKTVLSNRSEQTFAIFHYPLPHPPYLLNPDGSYRGYDPNNHVSANVEGYRRNLAYLDKLIGEFVEVIKATGQFDDSMLILTSDHSWRSDPHMTQPTDEILTHVPLIVKYPGQRQPLTINADFRTYQLGKLIGRGLREQDMLKQVALVHDSSVLLPSP